MRQLDIVDGLKSDERPATGQQRLVLCRKGEQDALKATKIRGGRDTSPICQLERDLTWRTSYAGYHLGHTCVTKSAKLHLHLTSRPQLFDTSYTSKHTRGRIAEAGVSSV